jgi:hypothetical protein
MAANLTELVNGYGRQLDTLSAADALPARIELLRVALLWVRLGILPGTVEKTLAEQLETAASDLWTRRGGAGLRITSQRLGERTVYVLKGGDGAPGGNPSAVQSPSPAP